MPYSGEGTEEEIQQRQQAARKHGAYSFQNRGETALDTRQRSRLEELKEQVAGRGGVLALMQERAANSVMMVELMTSHIAKEVKSGKPLERIAVLRSLPAFMNTAQRSLKDLITLMPDSADVIDAQDILEELKHGKENREID